MPSEGNEYEEGCCVFAAKGVVAVGLGVLLDECCACKDVSLVDFDECALLELDIRRYKSGEPAVASGTSRDACREIFKMYREGHWRLVAQLIE